MHTKDLSPNKIGQLSIFLIFLHRLLLNTNTNTLTQALQSINKWKNFQCCQLKFFNVGNTNSIPQFLRVPLFYPPQTVSVSCFKSFSLVGICVATPQHHMSPFIFRLISAVEWRTLSVLGHSLSVL
jgi:hypothetical protein